MTEQSLICPIFSTQASEKFLLDQANPKQKQLLKRLSLVLRAHIPGLVSITIVRRCYAHVGRQTAQTPWLVTPFKFPHAPDEI